MNEINIGVLLKIFKKFWWRIAIVTLAAMILVACFTHLCIPKKFSSSVKFYVVNINPDYDYTSSTLVSASTYLINDYVAIIKSDYLLEQVCEQLRAEGYPDITPKDIQSMISSSAASETSVFTLSISSTDKTLAYKVASSIAKIAPKAVTAMAKSDESTYQKLAERVFYVMKSMQLDESGTLTQTDVETFIRQNKLGLSEQMNCIEVLSYPVEAPTHDSPSLVVYTLVGGVAAAILTYVIFLVNALVKQTVTTEDDVKKLLARPLLGTIPHWEQVEKN